jgi:hypothetical protein
LPREIGVSNFIGLLAAADVMVLSWKIISTSSLAWPGAMVCRSAKVIMFSATFGRRVDYYEIESSNASDLMAQRC